MLRTRCILIPKAYDDGLRVSVMSRHTLSDGKTPDVRIKQDISYDLWIPQLAPLPMSVRDYYQDKLSFEELAERYRWYLQTQKQRERVEKLA